MHEIIKAIDGSIEKWKQNAQVECVSEVRTSYLDCPLCTLFHPRLTSRDDVGGCEGCPIREFTGFDFCDDTPYTKVDEASYDGTLDEVISFCEEEVEFLTEVRQNFLDKNPELR